jgi:glycosyltransferase involved in cell wall biosynthesis
MLKNKSIVVVLPAFNEEAQIGMVIESMPGFVDKIIVVNDGSTDRTAEIVEGYIRKDQNSSINIPPILKSDVSGIYNQAERVIHQKLIEEKNAMVPSEVFNQAEDTDRIILINHLRNSGVGSAVATAYKWCKDRGIDCIVKIDGDGQMDPAEIETVCSPVVYEGIDYVKGNRLKHPSAWIVIPRIRFLGNAILSVLTKIASGYWYISDTQTAFTAISGKALQGLNLAKFYKRYGYPNDILVKLNINFSTLKEVEIKPVYNIGEHSKMRIRTIVFRLSWHLFKSFFIRLWIKYLFNSFHPLFLLYHAGIILLIISIPYLVKILIYVVEGLKLNPVTVLAFVFLFFSGFQSILFAMWMDIQDNSRLYK